jgi:hypothetical protein
VRRDRRERDPGGGGHRPPRAPGDAVARQLASDVSREVADLRAQLADDLTWSMLVLDLGDVDEATRSLIRQRAHLAGFHGRVDIAVATAVFSDDVAAPRGGEWAAPRTIDHTVAHRARGLVATLGAAAAVVAAALFAGTQPQTVPTQLAGDTAIEQAPPAAVGAPVRVLAGTTPSPSEVASGGDATVARSVPVHHRPLAGLTGLGEADRIIVGLNPRAPAPVRSLRDVVRGLVSQLISAVPTRPVAPVVTTPLAPVATPSVPVPAPLPTEDEVEPEATEPEPAPTEQPSPPAPDPEPEPEPSPSDGEDGREPSIPAPEL